MSGKGRGIQAIVSGLFLLVGGVLGKVQDGWSLHVVIFVVLGVVFFLGGVASLVQRSREHAEK